MNIGSGRLVAWGILYFEAETLASEARTSGLFFSASAIRSRSCSSPAKANDGRKKNIEHRTQRKALFIGPQNEPA